MNFLNFYSRYIYLFQNKAELCWRKIITKSFNNHLSKLAGVTLDNAI